MTYALTSFDFPSPARPGDDVQLTFSAALKRGDQEAAPPHRKQAARVNTPSAPQHPIATPLRIAPSVLDGESTPASTPAPPVVPLTPAASTAIAGSASTSAIESAVVRDCAYNKHKRKEAEELNKKRQKEEEDDEEKGLQDDWAAALRSIYSGENESLFALNCLPSSHRATGLQAARKWLP